ncbi:MAG: low affinity iron permease family protein [Chitinophagaceae bacterium]
MKRLRSENKKGFNVLFSRIAAAVTRAVGSVYASVVAISIVIIWAVTGPLFNFSDTWQLVINTGTTIVTFIMVFIIQQSQNKDTIALQLKLNELIACNEKASNRLIDIEDLTDKELDVLKKFYIRLSDLAEKEQDLHKSHSIDEAEEINEEKKRTYSRKKAPGDVPASGKKS